LRAVLPCGPCQLDTTCDRLIGALAERFEDDVTVVLVRIPGLLQEFQGRSSFG
jgi:hypothetical protein